LSSETWKAALLSTGSIIEAVDKVMTGQSRNAFCAVRPPGHHAGVFGKTFKNNECDQEQTNGFCYINNVAVAAAYLKNIYRKDIKKIAIIDFDVHHGNGTQEIIECMQDEKVFSEPANMSILYDCDPRRVTVYKPWLDGNDGSNVQFQSVHLHGNNFYPNTGGYPFITEEYNEN
jgi:acetoin utilization deacetylase AcuC-like enzyme